MLGGCEAYLREIGHTLISVAGFFCWIRTWIRGEEFISYSVLIFIGTPFYLRRKWHFASIVAAWEKMRLGAIQVCLTPNQKWPPGTVPSAGGLSLSLVAVPSANMRARPGSNSCSAPTRSGRGASRLTWPRNFESGTSSLSLLLPHVCLLGGGFWWGSIFSIGFGYPFWQEEMNGEKVRCGGRPFY